MLECYSTRFPRVRFSISLGSGNTNNTIRFPSRTNAEWLSWCWNFRNMVLQMIFLLTIVGIADRYLCDWCNGNNVGYKLTFMEQTEDISSILMLHTTRLKEYLNFCKSLKFLMRCETAWTLSITYMEWKKPSMVFCKTLTTECWSNCNRITSNMGD